MKHEVEIGLHPHWHFWGLTFNADTLISLWIVSAVLIVLAIIANWGLRKNSSYKPGLFQSALELMVEAFKNLVVGLMGEMGLKYLPVVGTLFLFILFSNWFEVIPFSPIYATFFEKTFGRLPELTAPTSDLNVTAGLAVFSFLISQYYGVRENGLKYFKHFVAPYFVFLPLNLLEMLARPFSLAIRLFGNIFAKEVIIVILVSLLIFPILYPIPILALSVLLGAIQAYIFALLTTVYIAAAVSEQH